MPKKLAIQAAGSKEVPLEVVGNDAVQQSPQEQAKVYTPEDAEYQSYQDLLQGYFEKFTRWQEILMDEKYHLKTEQYHRNGLKSELIEKSYNKYGFRISQTPQGLAICTSNEDEYFHSKDPSRARQDTVMYAEMTSWHDLPYKEGEYGMKIIYMDFHEGSAGKQFFVDTDEKPLQSVHIEIGSYWSDTWREVTIAAVYPDLSAYSSDSELDPTQDIKFKMRDGTLHISKVVPKMKNTVLMPENHTTALLNTINCLIPGTPTTIQQPERRARQEPTTPKKLPAPGRRAAP